MITIDGWITIGTKLNTDKFDKQMSDLENKIDSEEKKQELLNNKTKEYESALADATREVNNLSKEYDNATAKAEELRNTMRNAPKGSFQRMQLSSEYDEQVKKVDQLSASLNKAEKSQSNLQNKVAQSRLQYENSTKAVDKLRGKVEQINMKRHQAEAKAFAKNMDNAKSTITSTIGQIGRMALAIFGVRSAYMAVRRASSTLAQYNEQYAKNLEYIRFALAQTLAPILEWIVSITQTLLGYINLLFQTLFGINLFANASSKNFEKMSKSASGVAKSTKEIKNNLASFDEINVLNQNNDTGGEGGVGGAIAPSFDLASLENIKIPEWLEKLKDTLLEILDDTSNETLRRIKELATEIYRTGATLFKTLSELMINFWNTGIRPLIDLIIKIWNELWDSIGKAWDKWGHPIFENLRIAIEKVGEVVQSLWDNFLQPIWQNIINALDWLWTNHLRPLWDNILDLFGELINGILRIWNETLAPFIAWIAQTFGPIISDVINVIINMIGSVFGTVIDIVNGIITSLKGIIEFIVGVFTGDWEKAWQGIKDFFYGIWKGIIGIVKGAINLIIDFINGMIAGIEKALNWIVDKINSLEITNPFTGEDIWSPNVPRFEFSRIPKLAQGGIVAKPTQAIIGEAGREAIMPLDNNTEWMDLLADRLAERMPSGSGEITIRFEGTMAQFVRELKPQIEIENRRAGARIITGGAY